MTPKHEDNNFIRGLIIGGLLAAITVGVGFLVNLYNDSEIEQAIELKNRVVDEEAGVDLESDSSEAKFERTFVNENLYYIVQELKHPEKDVVFRLLIDEDQYTESKEFNIYDEIVNSKYNTQFDGDTLWHSPTFSVWTDGGETLLSIDEEVTSNIEKKANGFTEVVKWFDDNLVIYSTGGVLGNPNGGIKFKSDSYLYNYKDKSLTGLPILAYGWDDDRNQSTTSVNFKGNSFVQFTNGNAYSDVFFEKVDNINDFEYNNTIYSTNKELKIDIISDYNLRNYEKGLKGEINGEEVILLWDQN